MDTQGEGTGFEPEDFRGRWERARASAFPPGTLAGTPEGDEDLLARFAAANDGLSRAEAEARVETLLRGVFDNSRKLAASLSRRLGQTWEPADFEAYLASWGPPCFAGAWETRGRARVLRRKGCGANAAAGALACDYWREACDGFVTGLGEEERLARLGCGRRGDPECVDVIFSDASESRSGGLAWGPVPGHMALDLWEAAERFRRRTGIGVELKGFREGVLFYAFGEPTDPHCGGGPALGKGLADLFHERFPGLGLKDVTPQAVLGTGAA